MKDIVLVDTGIWIDYLHGEPSVKILKTLLEENLAYSHILVEGELRAGSMKNRELFFQSMRHLPYLPVIEPSVLFSFIESKKLYGLGLSIVDLNLFASAKAEGVKIWTRDKNLMKLCKGSGLEFSQRQS